MAAPSQKTHEIARLTDRTLITIGGADAAHFLQTIITTDIDHIAAGDMYAGALLSPQGKVLFDFLIGYAQGQFFLDSPTVLATDFIKRLSLYKLRSDVKIDQINQDVIINSAEDFQKDETVLSNERINPLIFKDKRFGAESGILRIYQGKDGAQPFVNHKQKWDILRIENGIAESGSDFAPGDVFPHDINYDQFNGLSFTKGCYIGQEVISRMQHRGTARRRVMVARSTSVASPLPAARTAIEAEGKPLGTLGTVAGTQALALVRIDRVAAAQDAGQAITAGGVELQLTVPQNAHFTFSNS